MTEALRALVEALADPLVDPGSRTFAPWLILTAAVAAVVHLARGGRVGDLAEGVLPRSVVTHPSARLDVELLVVRQVLGLVTATGFRAGTTWWLATTLVRTLDDAVGVPALGSPPTAWLAAGYSAALFVAWDLSRFVLHYAMHRIPALWEIHQVHHSAEVLTPLTFHRLHPLESLAYTVRGTVTDAAMAGLAFWLFRGQAVPWTLLGVHAIGFLASGATGNLRHSHVWLRFPASVERWLLSPAQHQLHHSADPADHDTNLGTWLAIWDRWAGTLRVAGPRPPARFGIDPAHRNHAPDDLVGALLGPLRGWRRAVVPALLSLAATARAADGDPEPADDEDDDPAWEIVVTDASGVPRVAGSAHVVTEEELQRYGTTDITKALGRVPGVYSWREDGFGLRPNIGLRGANSDRSSKVALMEDGIPLAPAPYAAPAAYYFPMTQRLVAVEVYKGPASIQYGPQTTGGAVNVVTRATPHRPDGALDLAVGGYGLARLHTWVGTGNDAWGLLVDGTHLSSAGFKELDGGGPTGFTRQDLMLKVRRTDGDTDRSTLELKLGYGREDSDETYLGLSLEDFEATPNRRYAASQDDHMAWNRTQEELSWQLDLGRLRVRTVAWHHWLGRAWTKLNRFADGPDLHDLLLAPDAGQSAVWMAILRGEEDTTTADQVLQIGTNDRTFHSGGAQTTARWRVDGASVGNELEAGLRYLRDDVVRVHTEDPFAMTAGELVATGGPTTTVLDAHTRADAVAVHVLDDLRLGRFHLVPGARAEWIVTSAGTTATGPEDPIGRVALLPGVGASVEPVDRLDVFAGVHRGFSPVPPGSPVDQPPESSTAWELGLRATPAETHAELVGFLSDYANLTGQCTLSGGCEESQLDTQFDAGAALVGGLEAVLRQRLHLPHRLDLELSGTWTWTATRFDTSFDSDFPQFGSVVEGDELPYVPEHQGGGELVLAHPAGSLSLAATARSAMRDVAGQGEIPDTERIPPSLQLDASAEAHLTPAITTYAQVTNLTGQQPLASFRPFGARPVAPLTAALGVRVAR